MNFKEAFTHMLEGQAVKLPEWGGYWTWDDDEGTIVIHLKCGNILDIVHTEDVKFTIMNTFRVDWEVVKNIKSTEHYLASRA